VVSSSISSFFFCSLELNSATAFAQDSAVASDCYVEGKIFLSTKKMPFKKILQMIWADSKMIKYSQVSIARRHRQVCLSLCVHSCTFLGNGQTLFLLLLVGS